MSNSILNSMFTLIHPNNFLGGIHPKENKLSSQCPIEKLPTPKLFYLALRQHIGPEMVPLVKPGDHVNQFQKIAESEGKLSSCLHSPCKGFVKEIVDHNYMAGSKAKTIVIEKTSDEEIAKRELSQTEVDAFSKDQLIQKIKDAGIVGMGGAMFPTYFKVSLPPDAKVDTIVINAAECEPYITADHRLMLENSMEIIKGIQLIQKIIPAKAIIGIEENKKDAAAKLAKIIKDNLLHDIKVQVLKTKYPQGGEKNIIKSLLNRDVPPGKLPSHVGCAVQNVGTCKAIYDAIYFDKPLIERVVTVTGDYYSAQKNYMVKLGTPIQFVIDHLCKNESFKAELNEKPEQILIGGPMMGFCQLSTKPGLLKGNNCIILRKKAMSIEEQECINCSRCVDACPMFLMPNMIVKAAKSHKHDLAEKYELMNCYECGSCSYICPSNINHIKWFRISKKIVSARNKK